MILIHDLILDQGAVVMVSFAFEPVSCLVWPKAGVIVWCVYV